MYSTDEETDDENILETDMDIEDVEHVIEVEETVEVVEVNPEEEIRIEVEEAVGWVGGDSTRHYSLYGRDEPDQHPIVAITGLRDELDSIKELQTVYSDKRNQANYYLWQDENILQENRVGYFVKACSDINEIEICTSDNDIFGVTVDSAGFIGAQSDVPRDIKYGLVVTTGIVHVRCEQPVNVGDYVVSNDYGYAKSNKNGYKVVGRHQIDGIEYAEITLVTPIGRMCELTDDVEDLSDRMDDAETNIVAAMNVANAAYNKASEVGEISEEAIKNALEALDKSNETAERTDDVELNLSKVNEMAVLARTISESAEVSAERIRKEAVETANNALSNAYNTQDNLEELIDEMVPLSQWEGENGSGIIGFVARANADSATLASLAKWEEGDGAQSIAGTIAKVNEHEAILDHITSHQGVNGSTIAQVEQKADDNGASITSFVASVDKYSVGEYSQAYGLTREQATSILKPGYIYIPTNNFDECCDNHTNVGTHCETFSDDGETNYFTPEDYYVWGINDQGKADWIEHSVGSVWIGEAIPANASGKYQYWYIDSNTAPQGYEPYALYIWKDEKWEMVSTLVGNASNRAMSMIRQTTNNVALEVTNVRGEYSGLDARLTENEKSLSLIVKDGSLNSASIIMAINEDGSSVNIEGDHIVLNGATTNGDGSFQIHENGYMIATGGKVGGLSISNQKLYGITGATGTLANGNRVDYVSGLNSKFLYSTNNTIFLWAGAKVQNSSYEDIQTMFGASDWTSAKENIESTASFYVTQEGLLHATGADISGTVSAEKGLIGGWNITKNSFDYLDNGSVKAFLSGTGSQSGTYAVGGSGARSDWLMWSNNMFGVTKNGNLYASGGEIGGWTISTNNIRSAVDGGGSLWLCSAASGDDRWIYAKNSSGTTTFSVSKAGVLKATGATISGEITANSGVLKNGIYFGTGKHSRILDYDNSDEAITVYGTTWQLSNNKLGISMRYSDDMNMFDIYSNDYMQIRSTTQISLTANNIYLNGTVYGTSSSGTGSDIKKKNTISQLDDSYSVFFDELQPVSYKYNDGTSNRLHTGFIAQQVGSALEAAKISTQDFAGLIIKDAGTDEESWYLRYEEFVSLNTWQIQKAKVRITELENRVAELEKLLKE